MKLMKKILVIVVNYLIPLSLTFFVLIHASLIVIDKLDLVITISHSVIIVIIAAIITTMIGIKFVYVSIEGD